MFEDLGFNKFTNLFAPYVDYSPMLYTFDLFVDPEETYFPGGFLHE